MGSNWHVHSLWRSSGDPGPGLPARAEPSASCEPQRPYCLHTGTEAVSQHRRLLSQTRTHRGCWRVCCSGPHKPYPLRKPSLGCHLISGHHALNPLQESLQPSPPPCGAFPVRALPALTRFLGYVYAPRSSETSIALGDL